MKQLLTLPVRLGFLSSDPIRAADSFPVANVAPASFRRLLAEAQQELGKDILKHERIAPGLLANSTLSLQATHRTPGSWIRRLLLPILLIPCPLVDGAQSTALDRYVAAPDPSFAFRFVRSTSAPGITAHFLELTSQTWLTSAEVDRPVWKHWLILYVPAQTASTTALLYVDGGANDDAAPGVDPDLAAAAAAIRTVVADLRMIPNQPLTFRDESRPRAEDAIMAYSWDKFLRGRGEHWPVQLPMTKATVRAMDAVTAFARSAEGGGTTIDRYLLMGGSKRGWTSWLGAAVDKRVVGLIPTVSDLLNLDPSLRHHWQSYGFWTPALNDYTAMGIQAWLGSTPMRKLLEIIDPYEYRERFTMPKYIVNAAGDQFFHPASSRFYFDELPGQKYLWYVPNASHGFEERKLDLIGSTLAWAAAVINGAPMPRFTWQLPEDGRILLSTTDPPAEVRLWQATNPAARDFRLETIGPAWRSSTIVSSGNGVYEGSVPAPSRGWTAYFLEMTYPSGAVFPLRFSTAVRVVPDTLPHRPPLASVLAASYHPLIAPEAIVSAFGADLAERTEVATTLPLPVQLASTTVRVTDKTGVQLNAPLFFVSPGQTNFLVPTVAAPGLGAVEVFRDGNRVSEGQVLIDPLAPGLFSANSNGEGVAAAVAVTVRPDETQVWRLIFDETQPSGSRTAVPIALGSESDRVFLLLFGTGMRKAAAATATVGGQAVGVVGPLPAPGFVGLDQVNLGPLPRSLAGAGEVKIALTVDGVPANVVTVNIQ